MGLKGGQDLLRVEAVNSKVGIAWMSSVADHSVEGYRIAAAHQAFYERISLTGHPSSFFRSFVRLQNLRRRRHPDAQGNRNG